MAESPRRPGVALVSRFVLAGILNTLVGLSVTLVLDLGLRAPPAAANAAGYAVGICVSWLLQRRFVFRSDEAGWAAKARYLATIAIAFGLNQAVLWAMPQLVGAAPPARALSQVVAMATYTLTQFALFRVWVFAPRRT
jgi:putative flippase GtrA